MPNTPKSYSIPSSQPSQLGTVRSPQDSNCPTEQMLRRGPQDGPMLLQLTPLAKSSCLLRTSQRTGDAASLEQGNEPIVPRSLHSNEIRRQGHLAPTPSWAQLITELSRSHCPPSWRYPSRWASPKARFRVCPVTPCLGPAISPGRRPAPTPRVASGP